MSAACARLLGVERILKVDHQDYRLQFAAATWGVETINVDQFDDPAQAIVDVPVAAASRPPSRPSASRPRAARSIR